LPINCQVCLIDTLKIYVDNCILFLAYTCTALRMTGLFCRWARACLLAAHDAHDQLLAQHPLLVMLARPDSQRGFSFISYTSAPRALLQLQDANGM
jgi:hypothetical protein